MTAADSDTTEASAGPFDQAVVTDPAKLYIVSSNVDAIRDSLWRVLDPTRPVDNLDDTNLAAAPAKSLNISLEMMKSCLTPEGFATIDELFPPIADDASLSDVAVAAHQLAAIIDACDAVPNRVAQVELNQVQVTAHLKAAKETADSDARSAVRSGETRIGQPGGYA